MSLHNFVSQVQRDIVFDPRFLGIKAMYTRRVEDRKEGDLLENKCAILSVSPQGNFGATDRQREEYDARIIVIWARTEDLKFDGEPFLPEPGDVIEYKVNGVLHRYVVTVLPGLRNQSSRETQASFSYEDGLHGMIKIMTIKQKESDG